MINEKSDMATDAKPRTTLPGIGEKIIKSPNPSEPEQAEISVADAEPFIKRYGLRTN